MQLNIHLGYFLATVSALAILTLTEFAGFSRLEVDMTAGRLLMVLLIGQGMGYFMYYLVRFFERLDRWGSLSVGVMYGLALWVLLLPIASASTLITPVMLKGFTTIVATLAAFITYGVVVTNYTMIKV